MSWGELRLGILILLLPLLVFEGVNSSDYSGSRHCCELASGSIFRGSTCFRTGRAIDATQTWSWWKDPGCDDSDQATWWYTTWENDVNYYKNNQCTGTLYNYAFGTGGSDYGSLYCDDASQRFYVLNKNQGEGGGITNGASCGLYRSGSDSSDCDYTEYGKWDSSNDACIKCNNHKKIGWYWGWYNTLSNKDVGWVCDAGLGGMDADCIDNCANDYQQSGTYYTYEEAKAYCERYDPYSCATDNAVYVVADEAHVGRKGTPKYQGLTQTCESACGANSNCDDVTPGGFNDANTVYCSSNCEATVCSSSADCTAVGDLVCVKGGSWKFKDLGAADYWAFTNDNSDITICEDSNKDGKWGNYYCEVSRSCQQLLSNTCVFDDGWNWEANTNIKSFKYNFVQHICSGGSDIPCSSSNACQTITDEDSNNFICKYSNGWKWMSEPTTYPHLFSSPNGNYVCDSGSQVLCAGGAEIDGVVSKDACEVVSDGSDSTRKFVCSADSSSWHWDVNNFPHIMDYTFDGVHQTRVCSGVDGELFCNADSACRSIVDSRRTAASLADTVQCGFSGDMDTGSWGWIFSDSFNDPFLGKASGNVVGYLCDGTTPRTCGGTEGKCNYVVLDENNDGLGDEPYTCFSTSDGGFWTNQSVYYSGDSLDNGMVKSGSPLLCPSTADSIGSLETTVDDYVVCNQHNSCNLQYSFLGDGTSTFAKTPYFCVPGLNKNSERVLTNSLYRWDTALGYTTKNYYPDVIKSADGLDALLCTQELECDDSKIINKKGAYCNSFGDSSVLGSTSGELDKDLVYEDFSTEDIGCFSWLGPKEYLCDSGSWVNSYSPDDYAFQCPLPTARDSASWSEGGAPFISSDGSLVMEGHCFDEGPSSSVFRLTSDAYSSGVLTFQLKKNSASGLRDTDSADITCTSTLVETEGPTGTFNGVSEIITCGSQSITGAVSSIRTDSSTTVTLSDFIGGYYTFFKDSGSPWVVKKTKDYFVCVAPTDSDVKGKTKGDCNVVYDEFDSVDVDGCYGDNKISKGDSVNVTIEGESYYYFCDLYKGSYQFAQFPKLTIDEVGRNLGHYDLDSAPDPTAGGTFNYYINDNVLSTSDLHTYQFEYKVSKEIPKNYDLSDLTLECKITDGGSGSSEIITETFYDLSFDLNDLLEFKKDNSEIAAAINSDTFSSNNLALSCKITSPINEQYIGDPLKLITWTFERKFTLDDQGFRCISNNQCISDVCINTNPRGTSCEDKPDNCYCANLNTVCTDEVTWTAPQLKQENQYLDESSTNRGTCFACGGVTVSDVDLNTYYYSHYDFDTVLEYNRGSAKRFPTAEVTCDVTTRNCESKGLFVDSLNNKVFMNTYEWTFNGTDLVRSDVASECLGFSDVCVDGAKVVEITKINENPAIFEIYQVVNSLCLGNNNNEKNICGDDFSVGQKTGGSSEKTPVLEIIQPSDGFGGGHLNKFWINYLNENQEFIKNDVLIECNFEGIWDCWMIEPYSDFLDAQSNNQPTDAYFLDLGPNRIPTTYGSEFYDRFVVNVPFEGQTRSIEIKCPYVGNTCTADSGAAIISRFPRETDPETFSTDAGGLGVRVSRNVGDVWTCGVDSENEYLWVPTASFTLSKPPKLSYPSSLDRPYDKVSLELDLKAPTWPKHDQHIDYSLRNLDCNAIGGELVLTKPEDQIDCDGTTDCVYESSNLDRQTIVDSCAESMSSDSGSCITQATCGGSFVVTKKGEVVQDDVEALFDKSNMLSFNFLYDDAFQQVSCYSSKQCLGTCRINETYNGNFDRGVYYLNGEFSSNSPGYCAAISGVKGSYCYAGDYINNILTSDYKLGERTYTIACDEKQKGTFSCFGQPDGRCDYTCAWDVARTDISLDSAISRIDDNFDYNTYSTCDDLLSGENYSTCKDCCEAPFSLKLKPLCDKIDFDTRFNNGALDNTPNLCGTKLVKDPQNVDRVCHSSCGAHPDCDSKIAGGAECTEWCQIRTDEELSPQVFFLDDEGDVVVSPQVCKRYQVCFSLPFDPHCGEQGCELKVDRSGLGSYPLVVGRNEFGSSGRFESFRVYEDIDVNYDVDSKNWVFCTSGDVPIRMYPSENEVGLITDQKEAQIKYKLILKSFDDVYYNFEPKDDLYGFGTYFNQSFIINDQKPVGEACGLATYCMSDIGAQTTLDCSNYTRPGQTEDFHTPICVNHRCTDEDAVGMFFGTILSEDYTLLSDLNEPDPIWTTCRLGDCSHEINSCRAYFIGLNVSQKTFDLSGLSDISVINISVGELEQGFLLSNPIVPTDLDPVTNELIEVPLSQSGPLVLPGSVVSSDSYVFVSLDDGTNNPATSIAKLDFPLADKNCSSVDLTDRGVIEPSSFSTVDGKYEVACNTNSNCKTFGTWADPDANKGYGEVSICIPLTSDLSVNLNNYPDNSYNLVGLCANTCGDTSCDLENFERPFNCKDCCSKYGTGSAEEYFFTCYSQCDAPSVCDREDLGKEVSNGICGIKNDFCSFIKDYTEVENVSIGPVSDVINSTCYGAVPNIFCDFWINYTEFNSLAFDLDENMWTSLQDIPEKFESLKNVTIRLDGLSSRNYGTEILPNAIIKLPSVDFGSPYGLYSEKYIVKQNNRRATNITLNIYTLYDSELTLSPLSERGCYYRKDSGNLCDSPNVKFKLGFDSISSSGPGVSDLSKVTADCSINSIHTSVDLDYLPINLGDILIDTYHAEGVFEFDPKDLTVGRYVVSCVASAPYYYPSSDSVYVSIFGNLTSAEVALPSEIVPGSDYSLYLSKVSDEMGQIVPFYTYNWELVQGDISVPFGQTDLVEIPYNFREGPAKFVLTIKSDYYDSLKLEYPVTIRIPKQISTSISPGIIYVPLKGSSELKAKLILSNNGPTINTTISTVFPKEIKVTLPLTTVTVEGFSSQEVPITIQVPESSIDTDYVLTFKASTSGKLQDQVSLRLVQTQRPVYEFDIYPTHHDVDLVYNDASYNITLNNVGNQKDSYTLATGFKLSEADFSLDAGGSKEIRVTSSKADEDTVCAKSVRLLTRDPRCVTLNFIKREVTPQIHGKDSKLTIDPNNGGSLILNFTPGDLSGTYVIVFDSNLTLAKYERSFEKLKPTTISIPFNVQKSGVYTVNATAYSKKYKDKSSSTVFSVDVKLPAPYEVNSLLDVLNEKDITDAEIIKQMALARKLVNEGNFEDAKKLLDDISNKVQRLETISSYKKSASLMTLSKSYTFAIAGLVLIAVGAVLYLK